MAERPVAHNTPEDAAYKLMHDVAQVEGVVFNRSPGDSQAGATRQ
jgi:hypothetical protein